MSFLVFVMRQKKHTYYSDTRWKLIDVFELDGWTNIEMGEKMTWERIKERMQK